MTMNPFKASSTSLLPELRRCDHVSLEERDILIHAPGFEARTMALIDATAGRPGATAILLKYHPPNDPRNRLADVRHGLLARGLAIGENDILEYNRFEPGDFEQRLQARLLVHGARRAFVDISTMSKLAIMLVLGVCRAADLDVRILYSEAANYGPTEEEFETARNNREIHRPTLQVFSGIHGVVRVNSLASVAMQGQPTAALVFMSFNDALTQVLLNAVYPSRLFLINGRPPVHAWREKATAWIHDQVRREWEEDNPVQPSIGSETVGLPRRRASTLDYRETVSLLLELYWELSVNYRVLLAPAGSKLQAVGCYLVRALHPDIHIEYPSAQGYLRSYSRDVGPRWILELGVLSRLLSTVSDAERREYLEIPT